MLPEHLQTGFLEPVRKQRARVPGRKLQVDDASVSRRVGIEGYLRSHSWEDDQGKRRRDVEIVARKVDFLSGPREEASGEEVVPFEAAVA